MTEIMNAADADNLINQVIDWAISEVDIVGVALVGSHARAEARPDSDIDLVIITSDPTPYIGDMSWIGTFGEVKRYKVEAWGNLTSLRVFFRGGPEVEFGITSREWVAIPPDIGTARVVADGMRILVDPEGFLARLQMAVYRRETT